MHMPLERLRPNMHACLAYAVCMRNVCRNAYHHDAMAYLHAHLVHIPLHASQIWPVVDKRKDNPHSVLTRLRQYEIQPLQRRLIVHPNLQVTDLQRLDSFHVNLRPFSVWSCWTDYHEP